MLLSRKTIMSFARIRSYPTLVRFVLVWPFRILVKFLTNVYICTVWFYQKMLNSCACSLEHMSMVSKWSKGFGTKSTTYLALSIIVFIHLLWLYINGIHIVARPVPLFYTNYRNFFIRMTCFYEALGIYGDIVDKNRTDHSKNSLSRIVAYDSTFQISCYISTLISIYVSFLKKKDVSVNCQDVCQIRYRDASSQGVQWNVSFSNSSTSIKNCHKNAKCILLSCNHI